MKPMSMVHVQNRTHGRRCYANCGLLIHISKNQYAIVVHAGNKEGFIEDALLLFKSEQKSGGYHESMIFTNYRKWLEDKFIPNLLPQNCFSSSKRFLRQ